MHRFFAIVILSMLILVGGFQNESHGADTTKRVTLLPITTEKGGKYSQLRDALRLMIAGRLSGKDTITVVENSLDHAERASLLAGYPENAEELFSRLQIDYIGAGSIVELNGAMDVVMTFYNKEGDAPVVVSSRAESETGVMEAVDNLLEEIAEKVFGQEPQGPELTASAARKKGMEAFQTEHPDRKYKKEILSGEGIFADDAEIMFSRNDMQRRKISIAGNVVAVEVADLDSDGTSEIVAAAEKGVWVYRYNRGLLEKVSFLDTDASIHAMSIADVNGDGIKEICLSAMRDDTFSSMMATWTPSAGFRITADKIDYAVRLLDIPGQGIRLIGQRRTDEAETFFKKGIFYLDRDSETGTLRPGKNLFLPPVFTIFDFTYADIDGDGTREKVRISETMTLEVYDTENRLIWVSSSGYGGRDLYLGSRWRRTTSPLFTTDYDYDGEVYYTLQYLPVLPVAVDIDGNGQQEILTAKNTQSTFKELRNFRKFSDGKVACLEWNGQEMQELWATEMLTGYVSSIAFKELANGSESQQKSGGDGTDGRMVRMYVAQAPGQNLADVLSLSGDTSNLVVYDFKILEESSVSPKAGE